MAKPKSEHRTAEEGSLGTLGDLAVGGLVVRGKAAKKPSDDDGFGIPDLTGIKPAEELEDERLRAERREEKTASFLEAVPSAVKMLLERIRSKAGAEEARQILQERILDVQDPELRGRARWLYAREFVARAVENGGSPNMFEVLNHLGMKDDGLKLVGEPEGNKVVTIRVQVGKKFFVPAHIPTGMEPVVKEAFQLLHQLSGVTKEKQYDERKAALEAFTKDVSREWDDLLSGQPGTYVFYVPDEKGTRKTDTGERVPWTYFGGHLKVVSDGGTFVAVGALGAFERSRILAEAIAWQVAVIVPSVQKGFERDAEGRGPRISPERLPKDQFKAAIHLHSLMNRAFVLHEANMAKKAEADKAKAEATVEHEAFLLDGADGVAFVKHLRFNDVPHPWALVERKAGEIRVVEAHPAEDFFPPESFGFMPEGEDFAGLDKTLRNFLRYARTKAERAKEKGKGFDSGNATEEEMKAYAEDLGVPTDGRS
ncbi:MAG: hypothetical protein HYY55_04085 [Candidatus Niyogibacteria bacterium]|nr:MAG: hypothetical protein HYY55_04085 [Candidatus Niyogibacteria bacterium]